MFLLIAVRQTLRAVLYKQSMQP